MKVWLFRLQVQNTRNTTFRPDVISHNATMGRATTPGVVQVQDQPAEERTGRLHTMQRLAITRAVLFSQLAASANAERSGVRAGRGVTVRRRSAFP